MRSKSIKKSRFLKEMLVVCVDTLFHFYYHLRMLWSRAIPSCSGSWSDGRPCEIAPRPLWPRSSGWNLWKKYLKIGAHSTILKHFTNSVFTQKDIHLNTQNMFESSNTTSLTSNFLWWSWQCSTLPSCLSESAPNRAPWFDSRIKLLL